MSFFRRIRTWTTLATIGVSMVAVQQGASTLAYGIADASSSSAGEFAKYVDRSPVATLARRQVVAYSGSASLDAQAEAIASLLSVAPLDGLAWLHLAEVWREQGAGLEKVIATVAMSSLSAPNELQVMTARVLFAIPIWAQLPPDTRRTVIADLVNGAYGYMSVEQRDGLRAATLLTSGSAREEMRAALLLSGKKGDAIVKAFGLDKPAPQEEPLTAPRAASADTTDGMGEPPIPRDAYLPMPSSPTLGLRPRR